MSGLAMPTPYQWQVGDVATASLLNGQLYDGLTFLEQPPLFLAGQFNTAQSIPNATWTAINLDTVTVDTYAGYNSGTSASKYYPQQAGYYTVSGVVSFAYNSTGVRGAAIAKNSTTIKGFCAMVGTFSASVPCTVPTPTQDVYCNGSTDYLELRGYQTSGGALNTNSGSADVETALWIRFSHA